MRRLILPAGFALVLATLSTHAAPAGARSAPGTELFADSTIHRFKIDIAEPELEKLRRENRTYVHATVTVDDKVFKDVGVRLKGRGSFRPLDEKPSLALKFDEFVSQQQFHGLTRIMLNNSSQDSTYLSEYLGTSLFRDAGVPAARATHARVEINGRELGFYVLIEAMNKGFLKQHFANATGNLYEGYAQDIDRRLELDEGTEGDQSDVQTLVAAARLPVGERMPSLRNILDVDNFASFLAVCMLIAQHDSYPLNHNNYRLYREPDSGRFVMIAHGIDGSFTQNAMSIMPPMKYILTRGVMETPEGQQLYRECVSKLFTNIFRLDVMTNRIRIAAARLEKAALTERERTNIAAQAASFARRVSERHVFVSKQLGALAPATADGLLASFQRDFREGQPKSGWRYLWNLNGPIGDQRNYAELKWDGQRYTFEGGRTYPGPSPARFLRVTQTGGHPGQGFGQGLREVGNEIARYAIIAFTAPDSGRYRIVKSRLTREQGSLGGHLELRVFVDGREIAPALYCRSPEGLSFDREVGEVLKGSAIYIAIGPNETDSDDSFGIDFSITR